MKQRIVTRLDKNWPDIIVEYHKPIDLYVDNILYFEDNNNYKILWVKEVEEISHFKSKSLELSHKFDLILTYDDDILNNCDNSIMFEFGTSWIFDFDYEKEKKFSISHLTGNKSITYGHRLRKEIYDNQNLIKTPIDFYISSFNSIPNTFNSKVIYDKKNELFDSQFHICIENSNQKNLFTEKLIDCLHTKTVPIFYGCNNIGNFFDTRGFFIVNNLTDVIQICNNLNENSYNDKIKYVNKNFDLCLQYINSLERLQKVIQKKLNDG